ncbi:heme-degrading domain-containing protein [Paracidobacterium acidisoli]|uniref:UPF0303 protein D0Y96_03045 n=1 Tax=Paracidobacterium acidisoli TaxID=2303751 RepID=A0A372IUR5_9BACT|nr:heme-degrading domain-containing protein [Paracidobacterium acidisoli]MBT9330004.1 heme-degrading domain-containing protein [Paracidobacterium acidisoli]
MPIAEDLARIALQERELQFSSFNELTAWSLGSRLRDLALSRDLTLVIDIRRFGQPLFYSALPRTIPEGADWVRRKANVVQRFHRSSYAVGLDHKNRGTSLHERQGLSLTEFATHGGGFPIRISGSGVIGSVTTSGLTERADHEIVVEALCAELGRDYSSLCLPSES